MRGSRLLPLPAALVCFCGQAICQSVISTRSGVLNYFEGTVYIDNQQVQQSPGAFASVGNGSALRTEQGRAELLLTPGTFLRLDRDSSIRMISNSLSDTRIAVLSGSVILDSLDAAPSGTSAVLVYKDASVQFPRPGTYRLDAEPPVLQVYAGQAEIAQEGKTFKIDASHLFFFTLAMRTDKFGDGSEAEDDFYEWAQNRSQTIDDQNKIAEETSKDPNEEANNLGVVPDPDGLAGIPGLNNPGYSGPLTTGPLATTPYGIAPYNPAYGAYTSIPLSPYVAAPLFTLIVPRYWAGAIHRTHIFSLWHHRPWLGTQGITTRAGTSSWYLSHPWHGTTRPFAGTQGMIGRPMGVPRIGPRPYMGVRPGFAAGRIRPIHPGIAQPRYIGAPHFAAPRIATPHMAAPHFAAPHFAAPRMVGPHIAPHPVAR